MFLLRGCVWMLPFISLRFVVLHIFVESLLTQRRAPREAAAVEVLAGAAAGAVAVVAVVGAPALAVVAVVVAPALAGEGVRVAPAQSARRPSDLERIVGRRRGTSG